jgi:hypothetical protein
MSLLSGTPRRTRDVRVVVVAVVAGIVGVAVGLAVAEDPLPDTGCPELVAMTFIPRGTSGEAIIERRMYVTSAIPCGLYEYGMVTDTSEIGGATLTRELLPGQEFNATDFVGLGPARPR